MTETTAPEQVRLLRAMRGLLALTACLLAVLVLGLGAGAWYALQRIDQLEARTLRKIDQLEGRTLQKIDQVQAKAFQQVDQFESKALQQAGQLRRLTEEVGQVAAQRQASLSSGLVGESRATLTRLGALTERRRTIEGHPQNPFAKLDRIIDLNELMADSLLALLRHTTDTQEAVGKGLRPLPKPKALSQPGAEP